MTIVDMTHVMNVHTRACGERRQQDKLRAEPAAQMTVAPGVDTALHVCPRFDCARHAADNGKDPLSSAAGG